MNRVDRRNLPRLFAMALLALALGSCSRSREPLPPASEGASGDVGVEIRALHARPSPDGVTVGAIFAVFHSMAADTLISARVPAGIAGRAEIHAMIANDLGQMEMHHLEQLALPPGKDVELKPGGMHLMLFQLARPLVAGQSFPLTLRFARGGEKVIEVPIRED